MNVPPASSGEVSLPSRAFAASSCASRAIWPSDLRSASKIVGTTRRALPRQHEADVHPRVELELAVAIGAVHARVLAQRGRRGLHDHVGVRRRELGLALEPRAQLDRQGHVDVDGERVVGRRGLRLGHPPRDGLLGARQLLDLGLALRAGRRGAGAVAGRRRSPMRAISPPTARVSPSLATTSTSVPSASAS